MKHTSLFILSMFTVLGTSGAYAMAPHAYANIVTAHNIASIQHAITHTAFNSFEGSMGAVIKSVSQPAKLAPQEKTDPKTTYGRAPMYGSAPVYGEYNDDGGAGRSGGDYVNSDAMLNGIWFAWEHFGDDVKFDEFGRLNSKFDLGMMGLAGGQTALGNGITKWGIYTGYIGGAQENKQIDIDEQGGYFGIYNGFNLGDFNLSTTLNGGVIDNSVASEFGTDDYANFWLGAVTNATYNIAIDRTFTLQPGIQLGYTWIKPKDYTSISGDQIQNEAFSMLELSPCLRAIKYIGRGWYGSLNLKHIMIFDNGGELSVNNTSIDTLDIGNFTEYSLSLEKSIANVNFTANFGRRDGARDGWIGGLNIKYAF